MSDQLGSQSVQTNLKSIPNFIANVVNQYIVRPTGSPNRLGISGFIFDIVDTEEMMVDADITDHYLEDNTAIQDHIALRPERFILSGFVGELTDLFPNTFITILTEIQSLGTVGGLLPQFSVQSAQVYSSIASLVSKVGEVFNQAQNVYDIFRNNSTTATKQQHAFSYFYNMWKNRQLCQVETPYGILNDVAIESIRAKQDGTTRLISDFTVTFKKIRTTKTIQFSQIALPSAGRGIDITAKLTNNGPAIGVETDSSYISKSFP